MLLKVETNVGWVFVFLVIVGSAHLKPGSGSLILKIYKELPRSGF